MNASKGPKWPCKTMLLGNWIEQSNIYIEVPNLPRGSPRRKCVSWPPSGISPTMHRNFNSKYENEIISIK